MITGHMLRQLRERSGLSLGAMAAKTHYSKSFLSLVERGSRTVTADVVSAYERQFGSDMNRRGVIAGLAALTMAHGKLAGEIYASIAGFDDNPLATVQTTHGTDLVIASLVEPSAAVKLRRWMRDGSDAVLRVNAAGILAKVKGQDHAADVATSLRHDNDVRRLYSTAVLARVCGLDWQAAALAVEDPCRHLADPFRAARELSNETFNGYDAGARWCASNLLRELSPALGER